MATFNGIATRDAYYGTDDADQIFGNGGDDFLMGRAGDDEIDGGDDNDQLFGSDGNDTLRGGAGADALYGERGNDSIYGGDGNDTIEGDFHSYFPSEAGNDTIDGGEGDDLIDGFGGDDILLGGNGSDSLRGGLGKDYVDGGDGDDFLAGYGEYTSTAETSPDTLIGGSGNDRLMVGYGDSADGGTGIDSLDVVYFGATSGGVDIDFRQLANNGTLVVGGGSLTNIEYVAGISLTEFDDKVIAGAIPSGVYGITMYGWGGNDVLTGTAGTDTIQGGEGDDVIYGMGGYNPAIIPSGDRLWGEAGNDTIYVGSDGAEANGGLGNDTIYGGAGRDIIEGMEGDDVLSGGAGDDYITGWEGNDLLISGSGVDTLDGMDGDDRLYFGADFGAGDRAVGGIGFVTMILQGNYSTVLDSAGLSHVDTLLLLSGSDGSIAAAPGGSFTYDITTADDLLPFGGLLLNVDASGLTAAETLHFDGSAETGGRFNVTGGGGADTVFGAAGANILSGNGGDDLLRGGYSDDQLTGGTGNDSLYGNQGNDRLYGGADNDLLVAGIGNDQLYGEDGDDRLYFGAAFAPASDIANGGVGSDQLILQGNYNLSLSGANLTGIETLRLLSAMDSSFAPAPGGSFSYRMSLAEDSATAGTWFTIDAAGLAASETVVASGPAGPNTRLAFTGGAGGDTATGGGGDDLLNGGAGNDLLIGGAGNDQLNGGAGDDNLRGGAGVDTFDGGSDDGIGGVDFAYADKVSFYDARATQGVVADLRSGIISNDGFGNVETMTNIESLGAGTAFADTFYGNDGRNLLYGAAGDRLYGFGGDDIVWLAAAGAVADGGAGTDELELFSDGSFYLPDSNGDGVAETGVAMTNGWTVNLTTGSLIDGYGNAGSVAGFERVIGSDLADKLTGDGADNYFDGSGGNDLFDFSAGGNDSVNGGDGNDYIYFGAAFTAADAIVGGAGTDSVGLLGNYNLTLGANTLSGVENFNLLSGTAAGGTEHVTYSITTVDANVPAGGRLTVYAGGLLADESLFFNGYAETDGALSVYGGAGNDTFAGGPANDAFVGGAGDDTMYGLGGMDWLEGGLGADTMRGGLGNDVFVYQSAAESTAAKTDHILDFEYVSDHISLTNVDANTAVAGDQAFSFIGSSAFSHTAGELRAYQSGASWFVEGDVDGDGNADLVIQVNAVAGHAMVASDFLL